MNRFNNAISKLYTAYHNGTLQAGKCSACAVGNICDNKMAWRGLFETSEGRQTNYIDDPDKIINAQIIQFDSSHLITEKIRGLIKEEIREKRREAFEIIEKTGYTPHELAKVEYAFETNTNFKSYNQVPSAKELREDQFNGLCAVIKVLCEIEGIDNIMDYTKLFEIDADLKPVNELISI